MGDKSNIEWTDATWNPVSGCEKVSQGCKNCYAERLFPRPYPGRKFTDVRMHPERLNHPLRWKKPRKIFVNSMSDLFHKSVSFGFILEVFNVMRLAPQHTFQILTKRPELMLRFSSDLYLCPISNELKVGVGIINHHILPNVWMGVSVENQATADERIPLLLRTPAAVRWVSYEPALTPVDFSKSIPCGYYCDDSVGHVDHGPNGNLGGIDWIVAGGESGPKARPSDLAWYRSVRDQCKAAGVPFFMKQLGNFPESIQEEPFPFEHLQSSGRLPEIWAMGNRGAHSDPSEWPEDLRVREYPAAS